METGNTPATSNISSKQSIKSLDHYIVAIGASAGGLEAIHEFFDNMLPHPNLSFVVIQHLSPDYKSLLVELVGRHTDMKVEEAENNMKIKKECVYIIPNNKTMTISKGKLLLAEKVTAKVPNTAIDTFLLSMARDIGSRAIAIILSGTGTDGTKGIEAIREAGGLIVVQEPSTAKFDGMPNSAILSGNADLIISPAAMPAELVNYLNENIKQNLEDTITEDVLQEVFSIISSKTNHDFHYYKTPTLVRRIIRRMLRNNMTKAKDYLQLLLTQPEEAESLKKDFLINVTQFFRDQPAFDALFEKVLPAIIDHKQDEDIIKVWVTACSTGEEAYSIAILIDKFLTQKRKRLEVKIFASDIDRENIDFAARNTYPANAVNHLPDDIVQNYFTREGNSYSVITRLRKQIVFAKHNIIKDPPFIKNDLISCRNMLIYMSPLLQQKVLSLLHFSLNLNGYLFLGSSETAAGIKQGLEEVHAKWKLYKKTAVGKLNTSYLYKPADKFETARNSSAKPVSSSIDDSGLSRHLLEDFTSSIVDELVYAAFYIDGNFDIKESAGQFHRFLTLPQKRLNLNLLKMAPQELAMAINITVRRCQKENQKVYFHNLKISKTDTDVPFVVNISVKPADPATSKPYLLVILHQVRPENLVHANNTDTAVQHPDNNIVEELENELSETRRNLQLAIETLETTNEELQSSNEELLSSNEELQSSNEELQSLNEELHTLNTEHQAKIRELIELNDDLNNYFRSSDIGQIFLDSQLNIRRFTPAATRMINLIEADIGRPLHHISTNIRHTDVENDIKQVLTNGESIEKEVELSNGRVCLMQIYPYLRQDKKTDGVIVSFVDITTITNLNSILKGVFNASVNAILAFKAIRDRYNHVIDLRCITSNDTAKEFFDIERGDTEMSFNDIFSHLSPDALYNQCIGILNNGKSLNTEIAIDNNYYNVVAVKMMDGIVVTFNDITEKNRAEQKLRVNYQELIKTKEHLNLLNLQLEDQVKERTKELAYSEERFRLVTRATTDVVWDWNLINNQIWWNENFYTLFGYEPSAAGISDVQFWLDNVHPDDRVAVEREIYGSINTGKENWYAEYRFKKSSGEYSFILDRGYILRDEFGTPYRMLGSMMDVSSLKLAEKNLSTSRARFNTIYTAGMLGLVFSNFDGTITDANDAFLNMIGCTVEELHRQKISWKNITAPELHEKETHVVELLQKHGVCPPHEGKYVNKNGEKVAVLKGSAVLTEDDSAQIVTYVIDISEKKRAELKERDLQTIIRKQQEEFRSIFMNAPAIISIRRGKDLRLEFSNKAYDDLLQEYNIDKFSPEQVQGRIVSDLGYQQLTEVYHSGRSFAAESVHIKFLDHDSRVVGQRWYDIVLEPVFNSSGEVDGVASFGFEVTNLVLANKKLKASEDRFRLLSNAIPQKVWTAKPDGSVDFYNQRWYEYTGWSKDTYFPWQQVIHQDDLTTTEHHWNLSLTTGADYEVEHRLLNTGGTYRWHLSRAIALRGEQGKIKQWVGTSTDIHEQRTLAETLKASEDHFRELADQSPFMIWKVDKNAECTYVNKPWCEFTGLTLDESIGMGWSKALHPEDRAVEYNKFSNMFEQRSTYSSKFRVRAINGAYRWVLAKSTMLANGDGAVGSLFDITEQVQAEEAIIMLMKKKDEFMSIASHELKTPLTSMKASLQLVERMVKTDERFKDLHTFINKSNKQVNRLTSLVNDLLDVTKIQAGKLVLDKTTFALREIIEECADQVKAESSSHQISINGDWDVVVHADKHRMEQVVLNFLSNAIKYSPDESQVIVQVEPSQEWVRVSVTDFGIGIPIEKQQHVFDRFFRVQENSFRYAGLGLGLYISSEIVKRHGGEIGVDSQQGKGSTFWFQLPTQPA